MDEIFQMILSGSSVYHTYLGSAYCLTFPYNAKTRELEAVKPDPGTILESATVVPTHAIQELVFEDGAEYGRVGGMQYRRIEDRSFEGTINIIYDSNAGSVVFKSAESPKPDEKPYAFFALDEAGIVTLW